MVINGNLKYDDFFESALEKFNQRIMLNESNNITEPINDLSTALSFCPENYHFAIGKYGTHLIFLGEVFKINNTTNNLEHVGNVFTEKYLLHEINRSEILAKNKFNESYEKGELDISIEQKIYYGLINESDNNEITNEIHKILITDENLKFMDIVVKKTFNEVVRTDLKKIAEKGEYITILKERYFKVLEEVLKSPEAKELKRIAGPHYEALLTYIKSEEYVNKIINNDIINKFINGAIVQVQNNILNFIKKDSKTIAKIIANNFIDSYVLNKEETKDYGTLGNMIIGLTNILDGNVFMIIDLILNIPPLKIISSTIWAIYLALITIRYFYFNDNNEMSNFEFFGNLIGGIISITVGGIGKKITKTVLNSLIKNLTKKLGTKVATGTAKKGVSKVITLFLELIKGNISLKDIIKQIKNSNVVKRSFEVLYEFLEKYNIVSGVKKLLDLVKVGVSKIKEYFSYVTSAVGKRFIKIISNNSTYDLLMKVFKSVRSFGDKIISNISNIINKFLNFIKNLPTLFANTLKNFKGFEWLSNMIKTQGLSFIKSNVKLIYELSLKYPKKLLNSLGNNIVKVFDFFMGVSSVKFFSEKMLLLISKDVRLYKAFLKTAGFKFNKKLSKKQLVELNKKIMNSDLSDELKDRLINGQLLKNNFYNALKLLRVKVTVKLLSDVLNCILNRSCEDLYDQLIRNLSLGILSKGADEGSKAVLNFIKDKLSEFFKLDIKKKSQIVKDTFNLSINDFTKLNSKIPEVGNGEYYIFNNKSRNIRDFDVVTQTYVDTYINSHPEPMIKNGYKILIPSNLDDKFLSKINTSILLLGDGEENEKNFQNYIKTILDDGNLPDKYDYLIIPKYDVTNNDVNKFTKNLDLYSKEVPGNTKRAA